MDTKDKFYILRARYLVAVSFIFVVPSQFSFSGYSETLTTDDSRDQTIKTATQKETGKTESTKTDADTWYPFSIPWDDASDNIIHAGKQILDAPAGKHGFLKVQDGHFYFEDGTRIRFWGTNLVQRAISPSHEDAEKLAAHLGKFGFNIVRLHYFDIYAQGGIFDKSQNNTQVFDTEQLDRLDYLIYQLKQNGIYVDLNLHVARKFTSADGVTDADNLPGLSKYVTLFDGKLIELQKEYAYKLLTRFNPYTGTKYNEEPCIALVEITNENSLFRAWPEGKLFNDDGALLPDGDKIPAYYANNLDLKWNQWLAQKYSVTDSLRKNWIPNPEINPISNLVDNAGFEDPFEGTWIPEIHSGNSATFTLNTTDKTQGNSSLLANISLTNNQEFSVQLKQLGIQLEKDVGYTLRFKARANRMRDIKVVYAKNTSPWTPYGLREVVPINTTWALYEINFVCNTTTDTDTRLSFYFGQSVGQVWLDELELIKTSPIGLETSESIEQVNIARTKWNDRFRHSDQRVKDNTEFYYSLERDYYGGMLSYLKNDVEVNVPISTTNFNSGDPDLLARNAGDYMDIHMYWDHPQYQDKSVVPYTFKQNNSSMMTQNGIYTETNTAGTFLGYLSLSAVDKKPLVVSEWNYVFPNDYEYEGMPTVCAYALLQDWDGVFIYSYAGGMLYNDFDIKNNYIYNWFNTIFNAVKMAQMPTFSTAFIRGDILPAQAQITLNYSKDDILQSYKYVGNRSDYNLKDSSLPYSTVYTHKIRKNLDSTIVVTSRLSDVMTQTEAYKLLSEKTHTSDNGQIMWNAETAHEEYMTINTPNLQCASGFLSGKAINLDNLTADLTTDGEVSLISMDENVLGTSGKMLLTVTARQQNTGQIKDSSNGLNDWGSAPMILEPVKGIIKIKVDGSPSSYKVYTLDSKGVRSEEMQYSIEENHLVLQVDESKTPWYEIVAYPTGVKIIDKMTGLKVYPNPTKGKLNVVFDRIAQKTIELEVQSVTGGVILSKKYDTSEPITIDISDCPNGIYFIRFKGKFAEIVKKIILQK